MGAGCVELEVNRVAGLRVGAPVQHDDEFRAGARQWIFNISTKKLTAGNTYVYLITLNDGSTIQFQFTLK